MFGGILLQYIVVTVYDRKLYWTSTSLGGIYVSEMNGSFTTAIVKDLSPYCRGIALYPRFGCLSTPF